MADKSPSQLVAGEGSWPGNRGEHAELVRRALNAYLEAAMDRTAALDATFGADPDASPPSRHELPRA